MIKHSIDNRYSNNNVSTHDQIQREAIAVSSLFDAWDKVQDFEVIGIDEGQFFEDVTDFAEQCANYGKRVIIAALDGTFERKPFTAILNLIPKAESVTKLKAICVECGCDAPYSKRLTNEVGDVVVGGADKYVACCRLCYFQEKRESLDPGSDLLNQQRSPFAKRIQPDSPVKLTEEVEI